MGWKPLLTLWRLRRFSLGFFMSPCLSYRTVERSGYTLPLLSAVLALAMAPALLGVETSVAASGVASPDFFRAETTDLAKSFFSFSSSFFCFCWAMYSGDGLGVGSRYG